MTTEEQIVEVGCEEALKTLQAILNRDGAFINSPQFTEDLARGSLAHVSSCEPCRLALDAQCANWECKLSSAISRQYFSLQPWPEVARFIDDHISQTYLCICRPMVVIIRALCAPRQPVTLVESFQKTMRRLTSSSRLR